METFEYAIFFSVSRFTWPLAIAWVIFACHYGYGGFVNSILSCKSYVPITRLSYVAYLIHPVIMIWYFYTQETMFHGTLLTLVSFFFFFIYKRIVYQRIILTLILILGLFGDWSYYRVFYISLRLLIAI